MLRTGYPGQSNDGAVALNTAIGTTDEIPYGNASGGIVRLPAGSSITSLAWYVCEVLGGTYAPAYDQYGNVVTQTVVHTRAYQIPDALFGAAAIKAVTNAAGTVYVHLKG